MSQPPSVAFIIPPCYLDCLCYPSYSGWSVWDRNALDTHLHPLPRYFQCSELESVWLGLLDE